MRQNDNNWNPGEGYYGVHRVLFQAFCNKAAWEVWH